MQKQLEEDFINLEKKNAQQEKENLKDTISNLMSGLDDPAVGLNKSQIEELVEQDIEKLVEDRNLGQ